MAESRLILIDGYNLIHRSPALRPGPDRSLRESREKLVNLLVFQLNLRRVREVLILTAAALAEIFAGGHNAV